MARALGILSASFVAVWLVGCGSSDQATGGDGGSHAGEAGSGSASGGSSGSSGGSGAGSGAGSGSSTGSGSATGSGTGAGSGSDGGGSDATSGSSSGGDGSAGSGSSSGSGTDGGYDPSVYQHHKNGTRDGVYIDPAFTKTAAATTHVLTTMGTVSAAVYAQPLYVENGPGGKPAFIVATESNDVYAIDASTGANLWHVPATTIGTPAVPPAAGGNDTHCGQITPTLGITGTPFISGGVIYLDAMTVSGTGSSKVTKHMVYALKVQDGSTVSGWPVDVNATVSTFNSIDQNERGALQLVDGILYVPYGGHDGDCGNYYGWVVGFPISDPQHPTGWHTAASRGGIWGPGSLPTDGTSVFPVTGNTSAPTNWGGGEAVIRITKGAVFSGASADYFAPTNWLALDKGDTDLGGASDVVLDLAGSSKPHLVAAGGKDHNLYILNRDNLGGVGGQLLMQGVANSEIKGAMGSYTTATGTYVVFHVEGGTGVGCPSGQTGNIVSVLLMPVANPAAGAAPLSAKTAWCSKQSGLGSPMITTTDGTANAIVWAASSHLYAYDGDTGAVIVDGTKTQMGSGVQGWNTPIAASGHIAMGVNGALYLFSP